MSPGPVLPASLIVRASARHRRSAIRIGVSGGKSGHTWDLCAGCAVAVDEWRERRAGSDADVELIWEEDSFDPVHTRRAARRLVAAGCQAVIGHLSSSAALEAAPLYHQAGVPYFAPGATHPELTTPGYWNVLRVCGRDDQLAHALVRNLVALGARRVAVVWQDIAYGIMLAGLVRDGLAVHGLPVTLASPWNATPGEAVSPDVLRSDAVVFAGRYEVASRLVDELRLRRYTGTLVTGDDGLIDDFPAVAPDEPLQVYVVSTGVRTEHRGYARFHQSYVARAHRSPGAYSVTSFTAMSLVLSNLEVFRREGAAAGMAALRAGAASHEDASLLGPLVFTANGDLENFQWQTYRRHGGDFIPVAFADMGAVRAE